MRASPQWLLPAALQGTAPASCRNLAKAGRFRNRPAFATIAPPFDDFAPQAAIVGVSSLAAQRCDGSPQRLSRVVDEPSWDGALSQALEGVNDGGLAYEISKRLLIHWVPAAIAALAAKGVRVNTVSPGPVRTQMLKDFRVSMGAERIDAAQRLTGRHADAGEIAAPIAFLLGRDASWINGIDLRADGGLQALRDWQARTAAKEGRS